MRTRERRLPPGDEPQRPPREADEPIGYRDLLRRSNEGWELEPVAKARLWRRIEAKAMSAPLRGWSRSLVLLVAGTATAAVARYIDPGESVRFEAPRDRRREVAERQGTGLAAELELFSRGVFEQDEARDLARAKQAFDQYLEQFPSGVLAPEARRRRSALMERSP